MLQCETERLFVTADELPQLLGLPKREVAFLRLTGQLPQPIELLGGRFVYSVRGVSAWLDDNCPQGNPAAYEQFRERRARAAQAEFTEEAQRQLDKEEAERFAQRIIKAKPGGYVG